MIHYLVKKPASKLARNRYSSSIDPQAPSSDTWLADDGTWSEDRGKARLFRSYADAFTEGNKKGAGYEIEEVRR